jgi:hypothetical protein
LSSYFASIAIVKIQWEREEDSFIGVELTFEEINMNLVFKAYLASEVSHH